MVDINIDIEEDDDDEEEADEDDEIVPDIDSPDLNNPLAVVEYVEEIHDFYWKSEVRNCFRLHILQLCAFMKSQNKCRREINMVHTQCIGTVI
jgi:hypothetical protein